MSNQPNQKEGDTARIRLIVDTTSERRQAARMLADSLGISVSDLINDLIEQRCQRELALLREYRGASGPEPAKKPRKKKGE